MTPIVQMLAWQADCRALIDAGHTDAAGAMRGLLDALAEGCLIRMEGEDLS
jgi:hypothetical protein